MFSDELLDFIMDNEGFRDKPYLCTSGRLTIGYGHNLDNPISEKTARTILQEDIGHAVGHLCHLFPVFLSFPENTKMALIDMMFNMGLARFLSFKKMIAAINKVDWRKAMIELEDLREIAREAKDSKWYTQVGVRGDKVVKLLNTKRRVIS